jgi:tRNA1Val (adenine37-N6)-methyltransferase
VDVTLDSIRDVKVYQSKSGYRFSVDSLLLFDFVNLKTVKNIIDLGAGVGIIGLLLANRYIQSCITLVEIQDNLVKLAQKNISLNRLEDRVKVIQCDIKDIPVKKIVKEKYDLVVSNPPFRRFLSGRLNVNDEKAIARHELLMGLSDLIRAASFILKEKGRFCMIYHPYRLADVINLLRLNNIEPKRLRFVHSYHFSESKMFLIEAVKSGKPGMVVDKPFYVYNDDGSYTEEMLRIYNKI